MSSLTDKLRHFKSTFDATTPPELLETINRSISLLQAESIKDSCIKVGAKIPEFSLPDINGELFKSEQLLAEKPLVISFIRGGWCPYCMLEMQAWQHYYEASFQEFNIVAITPEVAEYASAASSDNQLNFPVLLDRNLEFADSLCLVWKLDPGMQDILLKWDIDIRKRNSDDRSHLPVPATLVVDQNHVVRFMHVEEDYTQRAEPEEVLKAYEKLLLN